MFAIVEIAKKQYIVSPNDSIVVPHFEGKEGDTVSLPTVLLVSKDDGTTLIGKPFVKKASATALIGGTKKGEKIMVRRYKSKVRYRKQNGFRPVETTLTIQSISF
jgi:large subunit ribosomal protein L21